MKGQLKGENVLRKTFAIVHRKSGRVIGWASLRWWRQFHTTADFGIAIGDKGFRGKGIGTEVTRLLTELAFEQYNMHKVELFTRPENQAMIRSAEKSGFRVEGKIRETVYFNGKYHDGVVRASSERNSRKRSLVQGAPRVSEVVRGHTAHRAVAPTGSRLLVKPSQLLADPPEPLGDLLIIRFLR